MLTIYETPIFVEDAAKIWSTEERLEFFVWIASEPEAGSVIKGSGGCRKEASINYFYKLRLTR